MSRTQRFLGGVTLGSLQLVLATAVGLWMTPFLLGHVGSKILGVWLIAQQLLGYLLLLDLGVNALLPREAAYAVGRGGDLSRGPDLPTVVSRARRAVHWQVPVVIVAAAGLGFMTVSKGRIEAGPLLLVLGTFALLFPMRLYQALLQGLQELVFLGRLQIFSWALTTALTVLLVLKGAGLWALVIGWTAGQLATSAGAWAHVRQFHRDAWPSRELKPAWTDVRPYVVNAAWISMAQFAQVMLTGSDLLMIGGMLGTSAVVLYSCTAKLTMVLANHPQLIMVSATPALSELWAKGERGRLLDLVSALTLAMLSISGLIACLALAVNAGFVTWWVGAGQYGGALLTALLAGQLIIRHWNITLIYGLLAFGLERRVSITNFVDGIASVALSLVLIPLLGPAGAVVGSTLAVVLISLPANLVGVSRRTGTSMTAWCRPLLPWAVRLVAVGAFSLVLAATWTPTTVWQLAAVSTVVCLVYVAVMAHGLRHSPLATFARPRIEAYLGPRLARLRAT
jgi:O-antigen/teichoic acid export membrane protein